MTPDTLDDDRIGLPGPVTRPPLPAVVPPTLPTVDEPVIRPGETDLGASDFIF